MSNNQYSYEQRWNPTNGLNTHHGVDPNIYTPITNYNGYAQDVPRFVSSEGRPSNFSEPGSATRTQDDPSRTRESSKNRGNRLRKKPPHQIGNTSTKPPQPNQETSLELMDLYQANNSQRDAIAIGPPTEKPKDNLPVVPPRHQSRDKGSPSVKFNAYPNPHGFQQHVREQKVREQEGREVAPPVPPLPSDMPNPPPLAQRRGRSATPVANFPVADPSLSWQHIQLSDGPSHDFPLSLKSTEIQQQPSALHAALWGPQRHDTHSLKPVHQVHNSAIVPVVSPRQTSRSASRAQRPNPEDYGVRIGSEWQTESDIGLPRIVVSDYSRSLSLSCTSLQNTQHNDGPGNSLLPTAGTVDSITGRSENIPPTPYSLEEESGLNRAVIKLRIKGAFHWMHPNFFHRFAIYSWTSPHSFQAPGRIYKVMEIPGQHIQVHENDQSQDTTLAESTVQVDNTQHPQTTQVQHNPPTQVVKRRTVCLDADEEKEIIQDNIAEKRAKSGQLKYMDVFRRKTRTKIGDRCVDPTTGSLNILVVQATSAVYNVRNQTTWRQTYMENISPYLVRLAYWPTAATKNEFKEWERAEWIHVGIRWLPACIGLLLVMTFPTDAEGQIRNNGNYDPFPYRFWGYPKMARNRKENQPLEIPCAYLAERIVRPRNLCFLTAISHENPNGIVPATEWRGRDSTYIFVSYTGEGQFGRPCKKEKPCLCEQCLIAAADARALHKAARIATKRANVPAYWTDQCCLSDPANAEEFSKDIYSISDVVRHAQSTVIILGESGGGCTRGLPELLAQWGSRMWTFPEVILAAPKKQILVYKRGEEHNPIPFSRLELANRTWEAEKFNLRVRELIDHYDGTLILSRLELVTIALDCLLSRQTTQFLEGDFSYALMGLLRQRPTVDCTDSAFQAFARLSLANDSDRLIERMICLLPDREKFKRNDRHYWASLTDHWNAKLWDVEPICQVAAIGAGDTVIIDGAYAATIHWDEFHRVAITTKETWTRLMCRSLLRASPYPFYMGIIILAFPKSPWGYPLLIFSAIILLLSPMLTLHVYSGKVWSTQPWLFGFEGHMSIKELETMIFGFPQNRLTWTPYGSSLSEHQPRESFLKNECRGIDPIRVEGTKDLVDRAPTAEYGEPRVFTLVDTNTMTVTLFEADRPPVVALLCGSEGGMQRAVMCSYDWPTQTLYRETVLRMETRVLEKMSRIGRFRLGLRRGVGGGKPETWTSDLERTVAVDDGEGPAYEQIP